MRMKALRQTPAAPSRCASAVPAASGRPPWSVQHSSARGNDAEDAFGADEQAIGAWPGSGAWQPAGLDDAIRGRHPQAFNEFVDMGIEAREMATGAGRDPTSEGGIGEALREMPERQPVRPQLFFDRRAEHASLDARGA